MTKPPTILVVEDDQGVRESLAMVLEYQEYAVIQATTGEAGVDLARSESPDMVLLDLNLPGIDGIEVCRRLRQDGFTSPVLMLTARHEVAERVRGLDSGADDYLPKPFALQELLARVRAMLRRGGEDKPPPDAAPLQLGDLVVSPASRSARRGDHRIELTKTEFDLLELLVSNADVVLSRDLILERIWGYEGGLGSNSLEVFISSVRRKTEPDGSSRLIHTVRGVGYVARDEGRANGGWLP